jgi:hypothetical protein
MTYGFAHLLAFSASHRLARPIIDRTGRHDAAPAAHVDYAPGHWRTHKSVGHSSGSAPG